MKKDTAPRSVRVVRTTMLIVAAISLFFAQSLTWIRGTLFDKDMFSQTVTQTLLADEGRQAVAAIVVDATLSNRPMVATVAGDRIQIYVAALISTDMGQRVVNGSISKAYDYVVIGDAGDISLQLATVKRPIEKIIALADSEAAEKVEERISTIPDEVVLLRASEVPNISGVYRIAMWVTPLLWLWTIALFCGYIYLGRRQLSRSVLWLYVAIIAVVGVGLMMGPFVPEAVASLVPNADASLLTTKLVAAFLAPFTIQMWQMFGIVSLAYIIFLQRRRIVMWLRRVAQKFNKQPA